MKKILLPPSAVIEKQRQGTEFFEPCAGVYRIVADEDAVTASDLAVYLRMFTSYADEMQRAGIIAGEPWMHSARAVLDRFNGSK